MIQKIIVPSLRYSQRIYEEVLNEYVNFDKKWLDLGCGQHILPLWRSEAEGNLVKRSKTIVGLDYDYHSLKMHKNISLKVRGDVTKLPFKDNSFDLVTANMVVEHLTMPENQFLEIKRILRSDGIFIFHTPNNLGYTTVLSKLIPKKMKKKVIIFFQDRAEADIFDTYYKINNKKIIYDLTRRTGYEIVKVRMINSSAQFIMIPLLVIFELFWIKILMLSPFSSLRPNIIVILRKRHNMKKSLSS